MKTAAVIGKIHVGNKVCELNSNLLRLFTKTTILLSEIFVKMVSQQYQRFIITLMLSDNREV